MRLRNILAARQNVNFNEIQRDLETPQQFRAEGSQDDDTFGSDYTPTESEKIQQTPLFRRKRLAQQIFI